MEFLINTNKSLWNLYIAKRYISIQEIPNKVRGMTILKKFPSARGVAYKIGQVQK
ncbi:MAG: hypothetical protein AB8V02_04950 [Francisella endosymbiont of Hyalomma asiaticum]